MDVKKELNVLCKALKKDKGYYYGWQANIAMAFFDEAKRNKVKVSTPKLHEISNNAAINFLNCLCQGG